MQFCQHSELNVLMLPAFHVTNILGCCLVVTSDSVDAALLLSSSRPMAACAADYALFVRHVHIGGTLIGLQGCQHAVRRQAALAI